MFRSFLIDDEIAKDVEREDCRSEVSPPTEQPITVTPINNQASLIASKPSTSTFDVQATSTKPGRVR